MPKQRPRPRRRAAPVDLTETQEVDDICIQQDATTSSKNKSRKRKQTVQPNSIAEINLPSLLQNNNGDDQNDDLTTNSCPSVPSAADIAKNLMKQLQDSELIITHRDQTATTQQRRGDVPSSRAENDTSSIQQHSPAATEQNHHAQLTPPLVSDPALLFLNQLPQPAIRNDTVAAAHPDEVLDLGIDNDLMGSTAKYMLSNSLPLGFHLSDTTKRNI